MTPGSPEQRLTLEQASFNRLTHYLFRFPAKFHPPIVRKLIEEYSVPGDLILDPFCGSGSTMVEAAVAGRRVVGSDVDPVAAFVSRVKTHRYKTNHLSNSIHRLACRLDTLRRPEKEYVGLRFRDMTPAELAKAISQEGLWVPAIPSLFHWFRKYVILDLARIRHAIQLLRVPKTHKDFLLLCFASIVRTSSNADPVPVSGLEVTSHMKRKEAKGRTIDPFKLFDRSVKKALAGVIEYRSEMNRTSKVSVARVDARDLTKRFRRPFDAIITSPPYHNAVDYYRRHKLEMFWLGFTETQEERLELMRGYVGRSKVAQKDAYPHAQYRMGPLATDWDVRIRESSVERANAFTHYSVSMKLVFGQFAQLLEQDKPVVMVVGNSKWNGSEIPTAELFVELAGSEFRLVDYFWYPIKNRYMSYSRKNGANIDREHVLVMRKVTSSPSVVSST